MMEPNSLWSNLPKVALITSIHSTVMLITGTVITSIQYVQIILITVSSILITSITSITIILIVVSITDDQISISVMLITQTCHSDHTDAVHLDHNV